MDQLLLGVKLEILAGASGVADPAIVEFDDKRLKPLPDRLRRCLSSALGHQPGAHAITDRRHDLVGPTGHHDSLVGQHGTTEPDLVATADDPRSAPRCCDRAGEIREHRGAGDNGTVVTGGEATLDRVHRVVGMLGKVDRRD
ncbi:MAG: hypothetical protein CL433_10490 [Acidimicrobiaceae bacterium]|nr:hypothetical protein [Acidimicrobiaceae bacterium]